MTEEQQAATAPAAREREYASRDRGRRRVLQGKVVSDKNPKTLVVSIERRVKHRKYEKYVRYHHRVHVHDEKGEGKLGDIVRVVECRRMSKLKRFRLAEVVERARS